MTDRVQHAIRARHLENFLCPTFVTLIVAIGQLFFTTVCFRCMDYEEENVKPIRWPKIAGAGDDDDDDDDDD